ncbi:MAG: hypothetical protein ACP5JN_03600, partial [Candidatus Micrarchaeia archaeon]
AYIPLFHGKPLQIVGKSDNMHMATIRNKLVGVRAAARVTVQRYGHTLKFAKQAVALVIKQIRGFTDPEGMLSQLMRLMVYKCQDPNIRVKSIAINILKKNNL